MGTMPPNPEKCNTILRRPAMAPNELMVEVARSSDRCVRRVEQLIRGHVTCAPLGAVFAAARKALRIAKPEAATC